MGDEMNCIHCGCRHSWLEEVNHMARKLTFECIECGTEQMVHFSEA